MNTNVTIGFLTLIKPPNADIVILNSNVGENKNRSAERQDNFCLKANKRQ